MRSAGPLRVKVPPENWFVPLGSNRSGGEGNKAAEALKLYTDGNYLWNRGQYAQAVENYHSALQLDPDFAMAHAVLDSAYYSFIYTDPVQGQQQYEKALALPNRTTDRERMRIQAQYADDHNHFDDAVRLWGLYFKNCPDDRRARYNLASLYRDNQRYRNAIGQFNEVLRISPADAAAYVNRATCYMALGKFPDAHRDWEKAFQFEPSRVTNGNLNNEYGMCLVAAGQEDKARGVFAKALEVPELKPRGLRSLAYVDLLHGHYRDATSKLQKALLLDEAGNAPLSMVREEALLARLRRGRESRISNERAELGLEDLSHTYGYGYARRVAPAGILPARRS